MRKDQSSQEKSGNLGEKKKIMEKLGNSDRFPEPKSSSTPQVQLYHLSFLQNAVSRSQG